jgi:hypothetical protein
VRRRARGARLRLLQVEGRYVPAAVAQRRIRAGRSGLQVLGMPAEQPRVERLRATGIRRGEPDPAERPGLIACALAHVHHLQVVGATHRSTLALSPASDRLKHEPRSVARRELRKPSGLRRDACSSSVPIAPARRGSRKEWGLRWHMPADRPTPLRRPSGTPTSASDDEEHRRRAAYDQRWGILGSELRRESENRGY